MSETEHRYFIRLAYNGENYHGWQIQENAPSVQETINDAFSTIYKKTINVVGCGRTDTGVHAKEFYAHFSINTRLSKPNLKLHIKKLNGYLPKDICIYDIVPVKPEAHARFDALSRTYEYYINREKDPFNNDLTYFLHVDLDIARMNNGAKILMEYEDFTSFSKVKTQVKTNICKISYAQWKQQDNLLVFTITADRFLRNMVRAIVGTLLDIGRGKKSLDDLKAIIESKNRSNAGYSVPAKGLFLTKVEYPYPLIF